MKPSMKAAGAVAFAAILAGCAESTPMDVRTSTPIKHLVVIFQENVSFDHYFGTYPLAANGSGEPGFTPADGTPTANTLITPLDPQNGFAPLQGVDLMHQNPNYTNKANDDSSKNSQATNPFRLSRAQAATADQDHDYTPEQGAFDNGLMDLFPLNTGVGDTAAPQDQSPPLNTTGLVMGYYDGNTVTALWNYAQHFAMSDNSFETQFGPSTPGALNLISGNTNGVAASNAATASGGGTNMDDEIANDGQGGITVTGDPQPLGDLCTSRDAVQKSGRNIGDLLNAANVSWGFFQGGFDLTVTNTDGSTGCKRTTTSTITQQKKVDYIPHHEPFQYYASTANPQHTRPSSAAAIGSGGDGANHQYDSHDFFDALDAGNFPSVVFLKAPGYQDGHAGYSDPLDEQQFVVDTINRIQQSPEWSSTAIVIAYDDSDGWYDHQMSPVVNPSANTADSANATMNGVQVIGTADGLNSPGVCNSTGAQQGRAAPTTPIGGANGRCGYGPRLPLLVVSPYAKANYIDHTLTDQTSILRFIEDNWLRGARIGDSYDALAGTLNNMLDFTAPMNTALVLDPNTGLPAP